MLKNFLKAFLLSALLIVSAQSSAFAGITEPLEIINETGQTIMSLYFVPIQKKDWGNDLVGSGVMNQGGRRSINYDNEYARYKIKVEFADGTTLNAGNINLIDVWRLSIMKNGSSLEFSKNARG